jgi:DNA replication protein DnaC
MTYDDDDDDGPRPDAELTELTKRLDELLVRFNAAKGAGDKATANSIAAEAKPLRERYKARGDELEAARVFARTCPIQWTLKASDAEIEARISDPVLKKFAAEPDAAERSALLLGPSKIGKSTTAALALRRALLLPRTGRNLSPKWFYARALAQVARQWPLGEGTCPEVNRASNAGLLIIDDLGLERDAAELVDVVHSRYECGLVTWTTSGLSMSELKDRYGEALVRRLIEGREQPGRVVTVFKKAA